LRTLAVVLFLGCLGAPAASASGPSAPWVVVHGDGFVNVRTGRPVVLRGFDIGFNMYAAQQAVSLGANMVRIPVPWSSIEPTAPVNGVHRWDTHKLATLDAIVAYLEQHNVEVLIDFHQVHWSPYFAAACNGGASCGPAQGIPRWYYEHGLFPPTQSGMGAAEAAFFSTGADQSVAAYGAFAQMMAARYSAYPNVVGYEILNEPNGGDLASTMGTQGMVTTMLRWQARVLAAIRQVDRVRAAFISCYSGGQGVGTAKLSVLDGDPHVVLDFHDFFNGIRKGGLDLTGDNWVPSWAATHNQHVVDYQGTFASQQRVLMVAVRRAARAGIPLFVGEWGAQYDDVNGTVYQSQMLQLFSEYGVSWTRWILNGTDRFRLLSRGKPTEQALQLKAALAVPPAVTSFQGLPLLSVSSLRASPAPVRRKTTISFYLSRAALVTVTVAHYRGAVVRHIPAAYFLHGGRKRITWRRRDDRMQSVPRGRYTITVSAIDSRGEHVQTVRVIRVRRR
jgi:hypothetical protein